MGFFSSVLSVGGAVLGLVGGKKSGDAASQAAAFNAALAEEEAKYQGWKNEVEQKRLKDLRNRIISKQKVGYASSGVQLQSQTVIDVIQDTHTNYLSDLAILKKEGEFNVARAKLGGKIAQEQANSAKKSSLLQLGSDLFGIGASLLL